MKTSYTLIIVLAAIATLTACPGQKGFDAIDSDEDSGVGTASPEEGETEFAEFEIREIEPSDELFQMTEDELADVPDEELAALMMPDFDEAADGGHAQNEKTLYRIQDICVDTDNGAGDYFNSGKVFITNNPYARWIVSPEKCVGNMLIENHCASQRLIGFRRLVCAKGCIQDINGAHCKECRSDSDCTGGKTCNPGGICELEPYCEETDTAFMPEWYGRAYNGKTSSGEIATGAAASKSIDVCNSIGTYLYESRCMSNGELVRFEFPCNCDASDDRARCTQRF